MKDRENMNTPQISQENTKYELNSPDTIAAKQFHIIDEFEGFRRSQSECPQRHGNNFEYGHGSLISVNVNQAVIAIGSL